VQPVGGLTDGELGSSGVPKMSAGAVPRPLLRPNETSSVQLKS
jgi:hypothetical protein